MSSLSSGFSETTQLNLLGTGRSHRCCDSSLSLRSAGFTDQKLRSLSMGIHGVASTRTKEGMVLLTRGGLGPPLLRNKDRQG